MIRRMRLVRFIECDFEEEDIPQYYLYEICKTRLVDWMMRNFNAATDLARLRFINFFLSLAPMMSFNAETMLFRRCCSYLFA